jgi:glycosyltransferase involved in cell wall biosynthesis
VSEPLVSVIVPAYNAARYIGTALDSVMAQTYAPIEIVVVDDGSTDETAEVVRGYGDRVRYVYQENARQAAARNHGVREARGDLIAFLDADDAWLPDKLARQVELIRRRPDLGLVYCSMREVDALGRPIRDAVANLRGDRLRELLLGAATGGICGSTPLTTRRVFDELGGFDPGLTPVEESDLFWRIATRYAIDYIDEPLVLYRRHAGNAHLDVDRMTRAWRGLYRKALKDPAVRRLGWWFRLRCRGRLYYMLAGDNARARNWFPAALYAGLGAVSWPPTAVNAVRRLAAHASALRSTRLEGESS